MAAPQFFVPQPVSRAGARRHFTLKQANSTLPLVKRIVADVVRAHEIVTRCQQQIAAGVGAKEQQRLEREMDLELGHLQGYMGELADVGCELKDCQMGLIDFIGRHHGRNVYLCWKLGEEQIGYFHEMGSGVAGRQPVSLLEENE